MNLAERSRRATVIASAHVQSVPCRFPDELAIVDVSPCTTKREVSNRAPIAALKFGVAVQRKGVPLCAQYHRERQLCCLDSLNVLSDPSSAVSRLRPL